MSVDREKVIKGLQCCQNIDVICMDISCYEPEFSECPYHGMEEGCVATLAKDAAELLKEEARFRRQMFNRCAALSKEETCDLCVYLEDCEKERG